MLSWKNVGLFLVAVVVSFCPQEWGWAQMDVAAGSGPLPSIRVERLANGIRVIQLPRLREVSLPAALTEIAFGYRTELRNESPDSEGVAAVVASYLSVSIPARSIALLAHLAGGTFEIVEDPSLVGMRVRVPQPVFEPVLGMIAAYFGEDTLRPDILEHARQLVLELNRSVPDDEFSEINQAVATALLGDQFDPGERLGNSSSIEPPGLDHVQRYFTDAFGTDRAYVILSGPARPESISRLGAVEARTSIYTPVVAELPELTDTELRLESQPRGGVILATVLPSVHFDAWYGALVVDRVMRRRLGPMAELSFVLSTRPSVYRIYSRVEIPAYSEEVRDGVLESILDLQARPLEPTDLETVKTEALEYLASRPVLEWFAAQDLWAPLEHGWNRIRGLTDEQFRGAARDFLSAGQIVAIWSPLFEQPLVTVDDLGSSVSGGNDPPPTPAVLAVPGRIPMPALTDPAVSESVPIEVERLSSGVTLTVGSTNAIFVAGRFDASLPGGQRTKVGTNGVLWSFLGRPGPEALEPLLDVRADRILVFAPSTDLEEARERFENWVSGGADSSSSLPTGEIATADMPSILVLKMWLDWNIIEAGWWGQVEVRIDGVEGARLIIDAEPMRATAVRDWISEVAEGELSEDAFVRVRNAAMGYFERIRSELQIILWQRAPGGIIQPPSMVTPAQLRDVARVYF